MKLLDLLLVGIFFAGFANAETVRIITRTLDGNVSERTTELDKAPDGAGRLVIPAGSIADNVDYIDVVHRYAEARKGDAGYWVFPRGELGRFDKDDGYFTSNIWTNWTPMPIFGMKGPHKTIMGIVRSMRFEYEQRVEAKDGKYKIFPRFRISKIGVKPYEDIIVDFYELSGDEADYNGMGRLYRKQRIERGEIRPIRERIKDADSAIAYLWDTLTIRLHVYASKPRRPGDQTPETEPPLKVFMTFDDACNILDAFKAAGVDKAEFCNAGWTTGGYDGRFPSLFPIEPAIGGEDGFKKLLKKGRDLGYRITCHTANTGAYKISPMWSEDYICKKPDGSLLRGETYWAGGDTYRVCLRAAWEQYIPSELEKLASYGIRGAHYIDVFSAIPPYPCFDPRHPLTRADAAKYQRLIAKKCHELFGGFSSECGGDHLAGELDYINYVSPSMRRMNIVKGRKSKSYKLVDEIVPLWEIVYHGTILYTADRVTQNFYGDYPATPEGHNLLTLKNVEFGARPIFYMNNIKSVPMIAACYKAYLPLRYLQKEFMEKHEHLDLNVVQVTYSDGSRIVCNYGEKDYEVYGRKIAPKSYEIFKGKL